MTYLMNMSDKFYNACFKGDFDKVLSIINNGITNWGNGFWNEGMAYACEGGNKEIVELMIKKGANYWNLGMSRACFGAKKEIINLMIEKGANDWYRGLRGAYDGGNSKKIDSEQVDVNEFSKAHKDIMLFMIEKGSDIDISLIRQEIINEIDLEYLIKKNVDLKNTSCFKTYELIITKNSLVTYKLSKCMNDDLVKLCDEY